MIRLNRRNMSKPEIPRQGLIDREPGNIFVDLSPERPRSGSERRKHERSQTRIRASVFCHGRHQCIVIRNISSGGLKMENAFGLAVGDKVRISTLKGESYSGVVAWSVSPYTGVKFDTPLDPEDPLFRV